VRIIAPHARRHEDCLRRSGTFLGPADGGPQRGQQDQDGRANVAVLLRDPPDYILTAKVSDMLLAVPKYGHVKVNKILAQCRISPSKTIGGLSERQRRELIGHLIKR
jgi:hypothetical protein